MKHSNLRGSDLHSPSNELVENNSGTDIGALICTTFSSLGTLYPAIHPAHGNVDIIRGVTSSVIKNGGTGYITSLGFLTGVNTNAWTAGTILFSDSSGNLITTANGLPVCTVLKKDPVFGVLYINCVGVTQEDIASANFPPEAELELMFSSLYPRPYQEFAYNSHNDITDMNVYIDNTKVTQIFNRHFTYDVNGRLLTVATTNIISGLTKTKTYSYAISGYMASVQES